MLNNPTVEKLKDLKLKVMARMLSEPDHAMRELSFEERLGIMVENEWLAKKNARIQRLLRQATLGLNACVEDIDYSNNRDIDKGTVQALAGCTFIEQRLNIVVSGKTGCGKTFLICALGDNACRHDYTVKYYRMPELLLEIQSAKLENRYIKFIAQLQKVKLLILDDLGLKAYSLEESRDILEIAECRYNKSSTILAGQIPYAQWYELFPDSTLADAIMDRVIHNAYILALDSKRSMRAVMAVKVTSSNKSSSLNDHSDKGKLS